jgi:hypothetical protein
MALSSSGKLRLIRAATITGRSSARGSRYLPRCICERAIMKSTTSFGKSARNSASSK